MKNFSKLAAIAACTAALVGGSTVATAAVPGNTVLTGDSVVANPNFLDYAQNRAGIKANTKVGCITDNSIANEMTRVSGAHVDQYQCAGASFGTGGQHIDDTLRTAARNGDLNPETRNVVIHAGANDTYPHKDNIAASEHFLRTGMRSAIAVAHHFAPNAKVTIVGYPRVSNNNSACLTSATIPIPASRVASTEERLQNTLREVAEQNGASFLDAHPISTGHDNCSPDRWWVNLVDPLPPAPGNLPLHLNTNGTHALGELIGHSLK